MKQAGIAILIFHKMGFIVKIIQKRWRRILHTHNRGKIQQDEVSILNTYVPYTRTHIYAKETILKLKLHIKPHALIV